MSEAEAKSLDELVEQLWASTEAARAATDKEVTEEEIQDAEDAAAAKEGALLQLANILETHPEFFERASEDAVYQRGQEWKRTRDKKMQRIREDMERATGTSCTGQPHINRKSRTTIGRLLEEGAWPHFIERMSLHTAVKTEKRNRTAAWQDMHSILADTHPHAPEITGRAATLQRSGPPGERLYSLRHKQQKSRDYPVGDPAASWSQAELAAYLRDHPDEVARVKRCLPGGFLSSTSRHLSEQHVQRSGQSHLERLLTPAKSHGQAEGGSGQNPNLTGEPVIGRRSRQLAQERRHRKGEADTSLWHRLSKPIQPPTQPPQNNPVPNINRHTASVGNESLQARVATPVHERLFKDHEHASKVKEEMKHHLEEMLEVPRKEAQERLRHRTQRVEASGDIFNRSQEWVKNVERKRERTRNEILEREAAAAPFKPDLKGVRSMSKDASKEHAAPTPAKPADEPRPEPVPQTQGGAQGGVHPMQMQMQMPPAQALGLQQQGSSDTPFPTSTAATSAYEDPAQGPGPTPQAEPHPVPHQQRTAGGVRQPLPPSPAQLLDHRDAVSEEFLKSPEMCASPGARSEPRSEMDIPRDSPGDGVLEVSTTNILAAFIKHRAAMGEDGQDDGSGPFELVREGQLEQPARSARASYSGSPPSVALRRGPPSPHRAPQVHHQSFEFSDFVPAVVEHVEREARNSQLDRDNTEQAKDLASNILRELDEQHSRKQVKGPSPSPEPESEMQPERHTADYCEPDTDTSLLSGTSVTQQPGATLRVEQVVRAPNAGASVVIHQGRSPSPLDMFNAAAAGAQCSQGWGAPMVSRDAVLPSTPMRQVGDSGVLLEEGEEDDDYPDAAPRPHPAYAPSQRHEQAAHHMPAQHSAWQPAAAHHYPPSYSHAHHEQPVYANPEPVFEARGDALMDQPHPSPEPHMQVRAERLTEPQPSASHSSLRRREYQQRVEFEVEAVRNSPPQHHPRSSSGSRPASVSPRQAPAGRASPTPRSRQGGRAAPAAQHQGRRTTPPPATTTPRPSFTATARATPGNAVSLRAESPRRASAATQSAKPKPKKGRAKPQPSPHRHTADEYTAASPASMTPPPKTLSATPQSSSSYAGYSSTAPPSAMLSSNVTPATGRSTLGYTPVTTVGPPVTPGPWGALQQQQQHGSRTSPERTLTPRGAHHAVRVPERVPVDSSFVGTDGIVRLLRMGKQRRLPAATLHEQAEQLYRLRHDSPPPKRLPTTSLDERGVVAQHTLEEVDEEDAAEISKALMSLPKPEALQEAAARQKGGAPELGGGGGGKKKGGSAGGKPEGVPRKELVGLDTIARFLGQDFAVSDTEDTSREEIDRGDGSFDSLNEHLHAEVERAVRHTSAIGLKLNTYIRPTALPSRSPERDDDSGRHTNPLWDATLGLPLQHSGGSKEGIDEESSLTAILDEVGGHRPPALPRGGRPFVVTGSPPRMAR